MKLQGNEEIGYELYQDDQLLCKLLPIPEGRFLREDGSWVTCSRFYMAEFPVTQAFYRAVTGEDPSRFKGETHPVEGVRWYDAVEFCERLNEMLSANLPQRANAADENPSKGLLSFLKKSKNQADANKNAYSFYSIDKKTKDPNNQNKNDDLKYTVNQKKEGHGFRLPTEAEWEYASRGKEGERDNKNAGYAGSSLLDPVAWYNKNNEYETKQVGLKFPNSFGLYDLSGNVFEWCWDWYADYSKGDIANPLGPDSGSGRVYRGGSWLSGAWNCAVSNRNAWNAYYRLNNLGFRVAFVP